jgi:aryl-alcohol dehydrogenase-like predicted oxidoreductase
VCPELVGPRFSRSFQQTPSWGIPTTGIPTTLGRTQRTVVVAFAWVLASGEDITPIPGTKRQSYLEENAAAADIALTPGEKRELDALFPIGAAAGERYSEA